MTCVFEVNCKVLNFKNEEHLQYTSVRNLGEPASVLAVPWEIMTPSETEQNTGHPVMIP